VALQLEDSDEVLIINDGSSDISEEEFLRFEQRDSRIRVINCEHGGLVHVLNFGVNLSRGEFIARADIDDLYSVDRIRLQKKFLEENSAVSAVFSDYELQDVRLQSLGTIPSAVFPLLTKLSLLSANRTPHSSAMFRKKSFFQVGGYKIEEFPAEDLGLWARMAQIGELSTIPLTLLFYRVHPSSITGSNQSKMVTMRDKIIRDYAQKLDLESKIGQFKSEFQKLKEINLGYQRELLSISEIFKLMRIKRKICPRIVFILAIFGFMRFPKYLLAYCILKRQKDLRDKYKLGSR
jgi:glycosyltransferase involved in cell wall biosynthesis